MGSETGLIQYKNKSDYLAKKPVTVKLADPKLAQVVTEPASGSTAAKTNISQKAKDVAGKIGDAAAKLPPTPPLSVVADIIPAIIPDAENKNEEPAIEEEIAKPVEVKSIKQNESPKVKNTPAIIFMKGLGLSSSSGDGLEDMASAVPKSEVYSWGDKEEVIESILARPKNQPVILVGHSLGGDSAVEVAQELNKVEHGFRRIDLLVTLDSIGFNNDIIPQNVKLNLNFIGDDWHGFNDSPNIARNTDYTNVINELREDSHRGLDNSEEVQLKIFEKLEEVLKVSVAQRTAANFDGQVHKDLKGTSLH